MNRKTVASSVKVFLTERKKLKNLEYYRITDDNKIVDLDKRRSIFNLLHNVAIDIFFISIINLMAIHCLIQHFLEVSYFLKLISSIVISFVVFIGYGGIVSGIVYKYTTTIYVITPITSAIVYFTLLDSLFLFFPEYARLLGYLLTTITLYIILSYISPVHILRKLNSKTALISSFTTILAAFLSRILQFMTTGYHNEKYLLTIDSVRKTTDLSDTMKI